jgi:hypothetical protein
MPNRFKTLPWRVIIPWTLCALVAAAAVTFFLAYRDLDQKEARRDEVQQVAQEFAVALTNFSHESIEDDAANIKSFAVGEFAEEVETFLGDEGVAAIREAEASSEGEIITLFIQAADSDEASAFVVVRETITNSSSSEGQTDTLRMEIGMIDTQDGWKVNRVEIFQAPGSGLVPEDLGR